MKKLLPETVFTLIVPLINGLSISESKKVLNDYLVKQGLGYVKTNYKLRDWLFSRQRYWGEPIPIIIDENENYHILADKDLPLVLPNLDNYKPSGTGEPLAKATDWVIRLIREKAQNGKPIQCRNGREVVGITSVI